MNRVYRRIRRGEEGTEERKNVSDRGFSLKRQKRREGKEDEEKEREGE